MQDDFTSRRCRPSYEVKQAWTATIIPLLNLHWENVIVNETSDSKQKRRKGSQTNDCCNSAENLLFLQLSSLKNTEKEGESFVKKNGDNQDECLDEMASTSTTQLKNQILFNDSVSTEYLSKSKILQQDAYDKTLINTKQGSGEFHENEEPLVFEPFLKLNLQRDSEKVEPEICNSQGFPSDENFEKDENLKTLIKTSLKEDEELKREAINVSEFPTDTVYRSPNIASDTFLREHCCIQTVPTDLNKNIIYKENEKNETLDKKKLMKREEFFETISVVPSHSQKAEKKSFEKAETGQPFIDLKKNIHNTIIDKAEDDEVSLQNLLVLLMNDIAETIEKQERLKTQEDILKTKICERGNVAKSASTSDEELIYQERNDEISSAKKSEEKFVSKTSIDDKDREIPTAATKLLLEEVKKLYNQGEEKNKQMTREKKLAYNQKSSNEISIASEIVVAAVSEPTSNADDIEVTEFELATKSMARTEQKKDKEKSIDLTIVENCRQNDLTTEKIINNSNVCSFETGCHVGAIENVAVSHKELCIENEGSFKEYNLQDQFVKASGKTVLIKTTDDKITLEMRCKTTKIDSSEEKNDSRKDSLEKVVPESEIWECSTVELVDKDAEIDEFSTLATSKPVCSNTNHVFTNPNHNIKNDNSFEGVEKTTETDFDTSEKIDYRTRNEACDRSESVSNGSNLSSRKEMEKNDFFEEPKEAMIATTHFLETTNFMAENSKVSEAAEALSGINIDTNIDSNHMHPETQGSTKQTESSSNRESASVKKQTSTLPNTFDASENIKHHYEVEKIDKNPEFLSKIAKQNQDDLQTLKVDDNTSGNKTELLFGDSNLFAPTINKYETLESSEIEDQPESPNKTLLLNIIKNNTINAKEKSWTANLCDAVSKSTSNYEINKDKDYGKEFIKSELNSTLVTKLQEENNLSSANLLNSLPEKNTSGNVAEGTHLYSEVCKEEKFGETAEDSEWNDPIFSSELTKQAECSAISEDYNAEMEEGFLGFFKAKETNYSPDPLIKQKAIKTNDEVLFEKLEEKSLYLDNLSITEEKNKIGNTECEAEKTFLEKLCTEDQTSLSKNTENLNHFELGSSNHLDTKPAFKDEGMSLLLNNEMSSTNKNTCDEVELSKKQYRMQPSKSSEMLDSESQLTILAADETKTSYRRPQKRGRGNFKAPYFDYEEVDEKEVSKTEVKANADTGDKLQKRKTKKTNRKY